MGDKVINATTFINCRFMLCIYNPIEIYADTVTDFPSCIARYSLQIPIFSMYYKSILMINMATWNETMSNLIEFSGSNLYNKMYSTDIHSWIPFLMWDDSLLFYDAIAVTNTTAGSIFYYFVPLENIK